MGENGDIFSSVYNKNKVKKILKEGGPRIKSHFYNFRVVDLYTLVNFSKPLLPQLKNSTYTIRLF